MNNKDNPTGTPRQALLRVDMLRQAAARHLEKADGIITAINAGQGSNTADAAGATAAQKKQRDKKNKTKLASGIFHQLGQLYADMQEAYAETAGNAGLSCSGCPQNCCHSYFRHHSFVEWTYLWRGVRELPEDRRQTLLERAKSYAAETEQAQAGNTIPNAPCPLLEDGRCSLYSHRLMICRMHGTKNSLTMPDGKIKMFSGCFRYVEQTGDNQDPPTLDRTPFYSRLAALELEFRQRKSLNGRVNLTIAEMLLMGPPK